MALLTLRLSAASIKVEDNEAFSKLPPNTNHLLQTLTKRKRMHLHRKHQQMHAVHTIPAAFSLADCDRILVQAATAVPEDAKLVGQTKDHNIRRADLVWLDNVPDTGWVMDAIIDLVRVANRDTYQFDLTEFMESLQVAHYDSAREGHFDWHSDIGDGRIAAKRKLTLVAQLSEPDAYVGGLLEVMPSSHTVTANTARGSVTIFPSYMLHRVTPVTEGSRMSMTVWAHGPAFR